jgi:hypothetical protein
VAAGRVYYQQPFKDKKTGREKAGKDETLALASVSSFPTDGWPLSFNR